MFDNDDDDDDVQPFIDRDAEEEQRIADDNTLYERNIGLKTRVINRFGIKAFKSLIDDNSDQLICPPNLFSSLLILYIGSNGDTFSELREFLNFGNFNDDTVFKIAQTVNLMASTERYKMRPNYKLWNDIRILIDKKADPNDRFQILVKRYFGVDIDWIDFKKDCHLICDQINQLIQIDFEDENVDKFNIKVSENTQLIVLSAVTFKGKWYFKFPADNMVDDIFYNYGFYFSGRTTQMMVSKIRDFQLFFNERWDSTIVEIPMSANSLTFLLILPKKIDGMDKLLKEFNLDDIEIGIYQSNPVKCRLYLPPFIVEKEYDFSLNFHNLRVFNEIAEMTQIAQNHKFKATNVLHKVKFEVDSDGRLDTPDSEEANPRIIKADHPFLFIVKDARTLAFLFIGKINYLVKSDDISDSLKYQTNSKDFI